MITEHVPEPYEYVWGSAQANNGQTVNVSGVGPYEFTLGALPASEEVVLSYKAMPRLIKIDKVASVPSQPQA